MMDKLAIYTVAMGGEYELPTISESAGASFYCFTDQDIEQSRGWTIVRSEPLLGCDTYRSSRDFKIRPHRHLEDYGRSIYIDSSVQLLEGPQVLWDHMIPDASTLFGGFFHSYRESVAEEFEAVETFQLEYRETLNEQRQAYLDHYPWALTARPVWGGFLARRHHNSLCQDAMETWFANVLRYSRRDQLSLPLALGMLPDEHKNILTSDIRSSPLHEWPRKGAAAACRLQARGQRGSVGACVEGLSPPR